MGATMRTVVWLTYAHAPTSAQPISAKPATNHIDMQPAPPTPLGQPGVCGSAATPIATMMPMQTTAHRINATMMDSECLWNAEGPPAAGGGCGGSRRGCFASALRAAST